MFIGVYLWPDRFFQHTLIRPITASQPLSSLSRQSLTSPIPPGASHHLDILSMMTLDQQIPRATPPRWLRFVDFRKNATRAPKKYLMRHLLPNEYLPCYFRRPPSPTASTPRAAT